MKKLSALKVFSLMLAGVGMLVANELQKRETREIVEEALAEREAELEAQQKHPSPITRRSR